MHTNTYIKNIKVIFVISVIFMIAVLAFGVWALDDTVYFTNRYARTIVDYFKYRIEFGQNMETKRAAGAGFAFFGNTIEVSNVEEKTASYVTVLAYHRIIDKPDGVNVTVSDFKDQLVALKKNGYETITLSDLEQFLKGEKTMPDKSILLTFDDGARDSFYPVDPLLRAVGYNAVSFVISGRSLVDSFSSYYLNIQELKAMVDSGRWEIGSHTKDGHDQIRIDNLGSRGNYLSNRMWRDDLGRLETEEEFAGRITEDLLGARNDLEKALGTKILGFAFPFGDYGFQSKNLDRAPEIVAQVTGRIYPLSFYQIFSDESAANIPKPSEDSFYVRRIKVDASWSGEELVKQIRELSALD